MRQGLSELAHEYTAMGVLGPIQLIRRRRGEYPLTQDTINGLHLVLHGFGSGGVALRVHGLKQGTKDEAGGG